MDDASLDEFLDSGEGTGSDGQASEEADESDGESGATDPQAGAVEPATTTLQYSPDGGACEGCGTSVARRWHSGTGLVCAECKEW